MAIRDRFERVRGSADSGMTTEQILRLTRGHSPRTKKGAAAP